MVHLIDNWILCLHTEMEINYKWKKKPIISSSSQTGWLPKLMCGLSLLLVLVLAPRGFSPGTPVFPSPQKPTFLNSNSIWKVSPISAVRAKYIWHLNKVIYLFIYFWPKGKKKVIVQEVPERYFVKHFMQFWPKTTAKSAWEYTFE